MTDNGTHSSSDAAEPVRSQPYSDNAESAEPQSSNDTAESTRPQSVKDTFRDIANIAHESGSVVAFYRESLRYVSTAFASPYAEIYVRLASGAVQDNQHKGADDPGFWKPMVQRILNDSLSDGRSKVRMFTSKPSQGGVSIVMLAAPIYQNLSSAIGAVAMVVYCNKQDQAKTHLASLESMTAMISHCAENITTDSAEKQLSQSASGVHLSRVAGYSSCREITFAIVNNLCNRMGCDQVILGLVNKGHVKIIALSGHDEVHTRSPDITRIREAMEECLDMDIPVVFQKNSPEDQGPTRDHRLHRQWHESAGNDAVASMPLRADGQCTAVVSFRRNASQPFTSDEMNTIRELAEPYTAAFDLLGRATRSLTSHALHSVRESTQAFLNPKNSWYKKAKVAILVVFVFWFLFGSLNYRLTVSGTIVPKQVRHFAAPRSAVLQSASLVHGDIVKAGDVLCVFNHDELLLEQKTLLAQLRIAQLKVDAAEHNRLNTESELAAYEKRLVQKQLDLVNYKIKESVLYAPFDGLVISGDLRKRVGGVLSMGEPLYEIASSQEWLVELEVPEHISAGITAGIEGSFSTNAKPELSHEMLIKRVNPKTDFRKTRNVYVAEAETNMADPWVKTGMEGVAALNMGRKPVWWIMFHRIIDYIQLHT